MKNYCISLIVAVSENYAIGKNNDLCWYLPKDLKYFKETTAGHTVIMGRKNWESIPEKYRPLKDRLNIVLTKNKDFKLSDAKVAQSLEEALEIAVKSGDTEPFIIGGGKVYREALKKDLVDKMYVTHVKSEVEGDTFFPEIDENKWVLTQKTEVEKDHRHEFDFSFCVYEKVSD